MEDIEMRVVGTGITSNQKRFIRLEIEISDSVDPQLTILADGLVATSEGTEPKLKSMKVSFPRTASTTTRNQTLVDVYGLRTGVTEE